ncbi:MAG: MBL fold metallo-hydrolase [Thermodesulfobacteriota bacterium]
MTESDKVVIRWMGAAHHHIVFRGARIVVDPLYTRLPGDVPHLEERREDCPKMDLLLLTHGHLDHSMDFPYLLSLHRPPAYAPGKYREGLRKAKAEPGLSLDLSGCRALEEAAGKAFDLRGIEITPYRIGTEEIDFWFMRSMLARPFRHKLPGTVPFGLKWLSHHLFGNCFAYHFRFPAAGGTSMLFFGNLTGDVEGLGAVTKVDVLALPYCPANSKWQEQTAHLIKRFCPRVVLVHHYDNFMNPYTLSKYLELAEYRKALSGQCPGAVFFYSKFCRDVTLSEILAAAD